jgi:hypothetical protein
MKKIGVHIPARNVRIIRTVIRKKFIIYVTMIKLKRSNRLKTELEFKTRKRKLLLRVMERKRKRIFYFIFSFKHFFNYIMALFIYSQSFPTN